MCCSITSKLKWMFYLFLTLTMPKSYISLSPPIKFPFSSAVTGKLIPAPPTLPSEQDFRDRLLFSGIQSPIAAILPVQGDFQILLSWKEKT